MRRTPALLSILTLGCVGALGDGSAAAGRGGGGLSRGTYAVDLSVWSGPVTDAEVDCFYDQGVRHVIVGTQDERIARQQLEMALARGMSVDAYVYLYWDRDMGRQVEDALALAAAYPIGRLWLDAEESPGALSPREIGARMRAAVDACGGFPCGIYTGAWWWEPHAAGDFSDVPLWYSYYDGDPSVETWSSQRFGGWAEPYGKQWMGDTYLCGIDVDQNTLRVDARPERAHPSPVPAPAGPPSRPGGLYPEGERVPTWQGVRLLWDTTPGATSYEVEIEHWSGAGWRSYFTYRQVANARTFSPAFEDRAYRFRVRASNEAGTGPWSAFARFDFGVPASGPPPEEGGPPPEEGGPPPEEGAPPPEEGGPAGAPTGLSPDGAVLRGASVTLSWEGLAGAASYEVEIEHGGAGAWRPYYTYESRVSERRFWPAVRPAAYRFRVRGLGPRGPSPWSGWASFDLE